MSTRMEHDSVALWDLKNKLMLRNGVSFKSSPENFWKEKYGIKNNTVRYVDWNDNRFWHLLWVREVALLKYIDSKTHTELTSRYQEACEITIKNSKTGETCTKEIRDVTFYDNFCIITWLQPHIGLDPLPKYAPKLIKSELGYGS